MSAIQSSTGTGNSAFRLGAIFSQRPRMRAQEFLGSNSRSQDAGSGALQVTVGRRAGQGGAAVGGRS